MVCFAGVLLKDGAFLGGEASYLAKIPLSFSLLGYNLLFMYYKMLIYVLQVMKDHSSTPKAMKNK